MIAWCDAVTSTAGDAVFVIYGFVAHAFRRHVIESASVQRWLRYSFAAACAGLGAKLAASER